MKDSLLKGFTFSQNCAYKLLIVSGLILSSRVGGNWQPKCLYAFIMIKRIFAPTLLAVALSIGVTASQPFLATPAFAQNNVSGDISGVVTDPTGALIAGAKVTITSVDTGATQTVISASSGNYRASLLKPGSYTLSFTLEGFENLTFTVKVNAGSVTQADAKLPIGSSTTKIEVNESAPLLHTESAEISTQFTQEQISSLPNPGNDLTFIGQTTPGAVMNTQGGYGNFASFGLPATANTFTINGGYENDPFLNVNNSGATNLLLGNNDVGSVTVLSNAYGAQYGGLGGTQVNEISRSGTNKFHGDATYYWNGSVLNANDYFNNQSGQKKPRSNANQWSGAIGGPIFKDKTFFFFNTEGLRVLIPVREAVYAPNANFIATTEANAALQTPAALPFYQNLFNVWTSAPGYSAAVPDSADPANIVTYNAQGANFGHEAQYTLRIDQKLGDKDNLFIHGTYDTGTQPTSTNLLNPIFNAASPQPQWSGQLNETHVFNPNVINQFVFAEIWYQAIFQNTNQKAANAIAPFSIVFTDGELSNNGLANVNALPGGLDYAWPQGRAVEGYQFIDDFSVNRGKHTLKAGFYLRRDDVTDYGPGVATTPLVQSGTADFEAANISGIIQQQFPTRPTQPVAVYNLGVYLQDQWKMTKDFILTTGIRFEHNSNPVCHTNCFASLSGNFASLSGDPTTPYSNAGGGGLINSGQNKAFNNFQKVGYEPRIGFAYTPSALMSKTTFRGGFGIFADAFPAQIADDLLNNAPTNIGFSVNGPGPLFAGSPGSLTSIAAASAAAFQSGYHTGGSFASLSASIPTFSAPAFVSPTTKISYPIYEEWNLAIEQQLGKTTSVSVGYVGNHTYHQPVVNNSINAFNAGGAPGFPTLAAVAPNGNFSQVTQIYSGADSNYNGLTLTATKQASYLTFQFNYTYSHALDEISNGGFNSFSGNQEAPTNPNPNFLRQNYGNADYDTRNYISANYIFTMPYLGGPRVLTKGWQVAGTVFHSSGLPFTFTDGPTENGNFANYVGIAPSLFAKQTVAHLPTKCSAIRPVAGTAITNNCAASFDVTTATDFGQQERNQTFGPSYTDTDMSVYKSFDIPHFEGGRFQAGVQFFNLLNHPNFGQPAHDLGAANTLGTESTTVNPPTSILGSFLGGDASPRLIQLKAKFSF
jgi:Carboxypeptidase regulatory-like domain